MTRITIEPIDYSYVNSAGEFTAPNQILKGEDAVQSFQNARKAINGEAGSGTYYSNGTTAHPTVDATASGANLIIIAKENGEAGNNIKLSEISIAIKANQMSGGSSLNTATGFLTITENPYDHKIFIGNETFRITSTPTTGSDIQIEETSLALFENIQDSINLYSMISNSYVTSPGTMTIEAVSAGESGNNISCSTNSPSFSFSAPNFSGGANAIAATGLFSAASNLSLGDVITVGSFSYTISNTVLTPGEVKLELTRGQTLVNLRNAMIAGPGAGVSYAVGTQNATSIVSVSTSGGPPNSLIFTAVANGNEGNAVTTTTTSNNASFSNGTLTGGVDASFASVQMTGLSLPTEQKIILGSKTYRFTEILTQENDVKIEGSLEESSQNLYYAVNVNGAGLEGINFGVGTTANDDVSSADLQDVSGQYVYYVNCKTPGAAGNSVATNSLSTLAFWNNETLSGGSDNAKAAGSFVINIDQGMPTGFIPAAPRAVRAPVLINS